MVRDRRPSPQAITLLESLASHPEDWVHGYELFKRTGFQPGTLYPLLERWAARGALDSRWEDSAIPGRPRRRLYRRTDAGRTVLQASRRPGSVTSVRGLREATP